MNKSRLKRILGFVGLAAGALVAVLLTARLGGFIESSRSGADLAATLSELEVPVSTEAVAWLQNGELARPLDQAGLDAIAEAYLLGLGILEGSVAVSPEDYAVHLTGAALDAALRGTAPQPSLQREHTLRVTFHSADGQVVELEDAVVSVTAMSTGRQLSTERAFAVLVLIDGVWHLRHRVVIDRQTELTSIPATNQPKEKP